jgi:hypothetical protein
MPTLGKGRGGLGGTPHTSNLLRKLNCRARGCEFSPRALVVISNGSVV